jgi:hypothetical protein
MYSAWSLGCPVVCPFSSGRIEAELRCLVVGAARGRARLLTPGRLAPPSSSSFLSRFTRELD